MMLMMLMLTVLMFVPHQSQSQPVLTGLVSEAQCRAGCLAGLEGEEREEREECWDTCASLTRCGAEESEESESCGRGCRRACSLLGNRTGRTGKTSRDLNTYQFSSLPAMSGCSLTWGPIHLSPNTLQTSLTSPSSPPVYLVVGQDHAGQWYEVSQTVATSTRLEGTMTAKLARLVVLGLTESGVQDTVILDTDGTNCSQMESLRTAESTEAEVKDARLTPRLLSLEQFGETGGLTEVRLGWSGGAGPAQFLVQWRRVQSGMEILGNLVTRDNTVQLTLHTDSLYVVTVRDVRHSRVSPDTLISVSSPPTPASNPVSQGISIEVIILLVLTLLAVATVMGIILHSRYSDTEDEEKQNQFNKQVELGYPGPVCLQAVKPSSERNFLASLSVKLNNKLSKFSTEKTRYEESQV